MMDILNLVQQIDAIEIKDDNGALEKKFKLIKSGLSYLKKSTAVNLDEAVELFKRVHWLGYEIGYNKATEVFANDFHKPLVLESLSIIRNLPYSDKRLVIPLKDALIYEYDEKKRKTLEQEIARIESQT